VPARAGPGIIAAMSVFSAPRPVIVGHRGAPRRAPENTPAAFAAAADEGARWVELDARRSADGVVVVHHDAHTPDGVPIVERAAATLTDVGVHRLDRVLDGLPVGLGVDVECKNLPGDPDYEPDEELVALVATVLEPRLGSRPFCTSSFNPATVAAAAAALPAVPAGLLTLPLLDAAAAADIAHEVGARLLCPHVDCADLDAATVAGLHDGGLEVLVWTVNDPARARALAAAGVDALCTDDPAGLLAALGG
jgi:glycerophosphoryl diester phosphodiesterase